jgi:hypothetical protein
MNGRRSSRCRSAPENIALVYVVESFEVIGRANHVAAVNVYDALRLAGRARCRV